MSREVAFERLFKNVFVCLECKAKRRAQPRKVEEGKVRCRKCGSKRLRRKSSESRG